MNKVLFGVAALSLSLIACTPKYQVEDCPAPVETTATVDTTPTATPVFPDELLTTAQRAGEVEEVRIYIGEDRNPRKIAVYHQAAEIIPESVKAVASEKFPGARIVKYEHEHYADVGLVYEVELETAEGVGVEVSVLKDGTIYYVEEPIAIEALAESSRAKIEEALPGSTIEEVESKKGPSLDLYSVRVAPKEGGVVRHYFVFDAAGKLLRHSLRYPAYIEVPAK